MDSINTTSEPQNETNSPVNNTAPNPPPSQQSSLSQETFLSQGQGDRFDRWVEFFSAIVLALATVLTAWCGYQASLWGGTQTEAANEAAAARIASSEKATISMLRSSIQVGLFVEYASAVAQEETELADFLYKRFPSALKIATDAWLATDPLENPDAPLSPFDMAEYQLPETAEAKSLEVVAAQKNEEASQANERSDEFVLLTVIFATVLFFGGISGKFQWRVIDAAMLGLGVVVMLYGTWRLLTLPMQ